MVHRQDGPPAVSAASPIGVAQASLVAPPDIPSDTPFEGGSTATATTAADGEQQQAFKISVEAKSGIRTEDEANGLDPTLIDEKRSFGEKTSSEDRPQQHSRLRDIQDFSGAQAQGKKRNRWYQLWRPKNGPPPPPSTLDEAPEIPLAQASLFSQLTYTWVTPLMTLGYQRPLMATDLWKMDKSREAGPLGEKFMKAYAKREVAAKEYNAKLVDPVVPVPPSRYQRLKWQAELAVHSRRHTLLTRPLGTAHRTRAQELQALEEDWRQVSGRRQASIVMSLNDTLTGFWAGGIFKVVGDTAQLMAPLLTKALITFSREGQSGPGVSTETPTG